MPEFSGTSVDSGKLTSLAETWTAWRCVSYEQWGFILIRRYWYVLKTPWLLVFVGYIFCLQLLATATWMMHSWTDITFWTSRVEASFTIIKSRFIAIFSGNSRIFMHFSKVACIFYFYFSLESHPLNRIQRVQNKRMWRFSMFLRFCWKNHRNQSNPTNPTNPGHSDLLRDFQISPQSLEPWRTRHYKNMADRWSSKMCWSQ